MRVTNHQLADLSDIIESNGLDIDAFDIIRNENVGGFKFKNDYFQFLIQKHDTDHYINFIQSVENRNEIKKDLNWEQTKSWFQGWVAGIKNDVEATSKLFSQKPSIKTKDFSIKFSQKFKDIYNQAYYAEQYGLDQICGLGYRKSFEFLIKDFLIRKRNQTEKSEIKDMQVLHCIRKYVTDDRVKALSERILWLGNDHAHYQKKWEKKSIDDLKNLIELALEWIYANEKLNTIQGKIKQVEKSMPIKSKNKI